MQGFPFSEDCLDASLSYIVGFFDPKYIIKRLSEKFNICYNRRATDISCFRHGWLIKTGWIAFKKIKWLGKER